MKKVNFEPNERVDAPDANAIGDVAAEYIDTLGAMLSNINAAELTDDQRARAIAGYGAPTPEVLGDFTIATFAAETQPYSVQVTSVPACFVPSEYHGKMGRVAGQNVESPLLDLTAFSQLPAGSSFIIYGRIKDVAGQKENRARWRADLNPPREEIYLANTRRLPRFEAVATADELPVADGWFKIAKLTRTSATANNLTRFTFQHLYCAALSGLAGTKFNFTDGVDSLLVTSSVPVFGSGITQVSGATTISIAPAVSTLTMPITIADYAVHALATNKGLSLSSLLQTMHSTSASLSTRQTATKSFQTLELSADLKDQSNAESLNNVKSLPDLLSKLIKLVKSMQLGLPLRDDRTNTATATDGLGFWSLPTFSHATLGNISLRSLHRDIAVGFDKDAPCEELLPESAFKSGMAASMFMSRYAYRARNPLSTALSTARGVTFTGFVRQQARRLDPVYFGGVGQKGLVGSLARHGGLPVVGMSPASIPVVEALAGEPFDSSRNEGLHRHLNGNGVFLRKVDGSGAIFCWASAPIASASDTLAGGRRLSVSQLNMTDLPPSFNLTDGLARETSDTHALTLSQETLSKGVMYVAAGGLSFKDSEFWMFQDSANLGADSDTVTLSFDTGAGAATRQAPYAGNFIEIVLSDDRNADLPIVFDGCSFFRNANTSAPMIRVRRMSGAPVSNARLVFKDCLFVDFDLYNNQADVPSFRRAPADAARSSLVSFDSASVSMKVSFDGCAFSCNMNFIASSQESCSFGDTSTATYRSLYAAPNEDLALADGYNFSAQTRAHLASAELVELIPAGLTSELLDSEAVARLRASGGTWGLDSDNIFTFYEPADNSDYDAHPFDSQEGFLSHVGGDYGSIYTTGSNLLPLQVIKAEQGAANGGEPSAETLGRAAIEARSFVRHTSRDDDRSLLPLVGAGVDLDADDNPVVGGVKLHHGARSESIAKIMFDPSVQQRYAYPLRLPATLHNNRRTGSLSSLHSQLGISEKLAQGDLRAEHGLVVESTLLKGEEYNARGAKGIFKDVLFNGAGAGDNYADNGTKTMTANGILSDTTLGESDERSFVSASVVYMGSPNDSSTLPVGRHYFEAASRRTVTHLRVMNTLIYDPAMSDFGMSYYTQITTGAGHSFAGHAKSNFPTDSEQVRNKHGDMVYDAASTYTSNVLHTDVFGRSGSAPSFGFEGFDIDIKTSLFASLPASGDPSSRGVIALDPFGVLSEVGLGALEVGSKVGEMLRSALGGGLTDRDLAIKSPFMRLTNGNYATAPNLKIESFDTFNITASDVSFKTAFSAATGTMFSTIPKFTLVRLFNLPVWAIHCTHYGASGELVSEGFVKNSFTLQDVYDGNPIIKPAISSSDSLFNGGFYLNVDMSEVAFTRRSIGFEFALSVTLSGV
jgi:hypothetical protein